MTSWFVTWKHYGTGKVTTMMIVMLHRGYGSSPRGGKVPIMSDLGRHTYAHLMAEQSPLTGLCPCGSCVAARRVAARRVPAQPTLVAKVPKGRRTIPQAVKVAVAARDGGCCQCVASSCHGFEGMCGSKDEPHYDHIVPWSKGGKDTVSNLQILCGPCNRRKGDDDIT